MQHSQSKSKLLVTSNSLDYSACSTFWFKTLLILRIYYSYYCSITYSIQSGPTKNLEEKPMCEVSYVRMLENELQWIIKEMPPKSKVTGDTWIYHASAAPNNVLIPWQGKLTFRKAINTTHPYSNKRNYRHLFKNTSLV